MLGKFADIRWWPVLSVAVAIATFAGLGSTYAQDRFAEAQEIGKKPLVEPYDVHAADVDGDDDPDIVASSFQKGQVVWYENQTSSFSEMQIITSDLPGARSVATLNVDDDVDLDVVAAAWKSNAPHRIVWFENVAENFESVNTVAEKALHVRHVRAVHLNSDTDQDILAAQHNSVVWYQNRGAGKFSSARYMSRSTQNAQSVFATDLDGDGDRDVLSASFRDNKIAWYENVQGGFGRQQVITTNVRNPTSVYAADIDSDGDQDVLSSSLMDNKIAWYENTADGFGKQQVIARNPMGPQAIQAADLDGDKDPDILAGFFLAGQVAWYENTDGGFSSARIISTNAPSAAAVQAADFNGDDQLDVVAAARDRNALIWFENTGESGQ